MLESVPVDGHVGPGRTSYLEVLTAPRVIQVSLELSLTSGEEEARLSHVLCVSVPCLGDVS